MSCLNMRDARGGRVQFTDNIFKENNLFGTLEKIYDCFRNEIVWKK